MLNARARNLLSVTLLVCFLIVGSVRLSAQSTPILDSSLSPPEADTFFRSLGRVEILAGQWPTIAYDPSAPNTRRSTGRAPNITQTADGSTDSLSSSFAGNAAFVVEIYPDEEIHYVPNTTTPGAWVYVGDVAGTAYFAGDFVGGDFGQMYVIDYNRNELHSLQTASGVDSLVGRCTPVSGQVWTGATGTADGTLYASSTDGSSSYLYTVNLTTGAAAVVGQITNATAIIDIAINPGGEIYGVDIASDNLVHIDPDTGAGTVVGSIGFDADYAQSMDFEDVSGILYLAAYNTTASRGELRIANTTTGNSVLVGSFPDGAQVGVLAFTPPPTQRLRNRGFEDGWEYWQTEGSPYLSDSSHSESWSVSLSGEECWVWQEVHIPSDAIEVSIGYWLTGLSSDTEWDNDILCGAIWDRSRQIEYADVCFGLTYFYSYPMEWKERFYRLGADELANVAGRNVVVAFRLTQDWLPGYHKTSTAWVDDTALYVTRPTYDHAVYLPLVVR